MKEQQYSAPSPFDHNATEPIGNRDPSRQIVIDHDDEVTQGIAPDPFHERAFEQSFQNAEFLFDPRNPRHIKLYDTSLYEQLKAHEQLKETAFTTKELAELPTEHNPDLRILTEARVNLDTSTPSRRERVTMSRTERRALKQEQQSAQDSFESARHTYLESVAPKVEQASPLATLTVARAQLAEAAFEARQGRLTGNKKALETFAEAQELYATTRDRFFEEQLDLHAPGMSKAERQQLRTSLKDHERGALAGEEANFFLSEVNDEGKKSFFRKMTDRYNTLSRPKKIAAGIAAVAVGSIGFGAIGGFAAVGGVAAVKFGRTYLNGEADRLRTANNTRAQQETSALHAGTLESSLEERTLIDESRKRKDQIFVATQRSFDEQRTAAIAHESARITKDRRKILGKAALFTVIPFAGAAAGALLEHALPVLSHGLFRENGLPRFRAPGFHIDDQPDSSPPSDTGADNTAAQPPSNSGDTSPDTQPAAPSYPETPVVSPHEQYLYDAYAGKNLSVTIPSGSSIWQEVSQTVAQQNVSFGERERITGNIVNEILRQNPTINPESVSVGQQISIKLPS